jgi:hypothetical protein
MPAGNPTVNVPPLPPPEPVLVRKFIIPPRFRGLNTYTLKGSGLPLS